MRARRRLDDRAHAMWIGGQDQRQQQSLLQAHRRLRAIRCRGGRNQGQFFIEQVLAGKLVDAAVVEQQGQVDLAVAQLLDEVAGQLFRQLQFDLRQVLADGLQERQGQCIRGTVRYAEDDLAARIAGAVANAGCGVVHLPEDGRGVGEEDAAGLAQFDPAPRAVEQARPQLCFELRELMAERGLGDEHLLGRLREAAVLGNGRKISQLAEFHGDAMVHVQS
jgi:hypothetical protein